MISFFILIYDIISFKLGIVVSVNSLILSILCINGEVMIILLISLLLGVVSFLTIYMIFGIIAAVFPFFVVFILSYLGLSKIVSKRVELLMIEVQREIQRQNIDYSIDMLLRIKKRFSKWQFFMKNIVNGQIGSIFYMRQKYKKAQPYLEKSFSRHWVARVMLGIIYFRKKKYAKMNSVFELASKYSSKQGLLWSVWAYCLVRIGEQNKAIDILLKGKKKMGNVDNCLNQNLINLQNKKKMKMRSYGEQWYQFNLESTSKYHKRGNIIKYYKY